MATTAYILTQAQFGQLSETAQQEVLEVLRRPPPLQIPPWPAAELEAAMATRSPSPSERRRPMPRTDDYHTPHRPIQQREPSAPRRPSVPREEDTWPPALAPAPNLSHFEMNCPFFSDEYHAARSDRERREAILRAADYIQAQREQRGNIHQQG